MSQKDEIFLKKTIEAAVNTIMAKMDELHGASDSAKDIMRRRWIWELIQNANDCANAREVSIWKPPAYRESIMLYSDSIKNAH